MASPSNDGCGPQRGSAARPASARTGSGPHSPEPALRAAEEWVTLAHLVKTQGHRGELAAEVLTDIPGRFDALTRVSLLHPSGRRLEATLTRHWPHQERVVLGFAEIPDMTSAQAWVGAVVQVPRSERAPAPAGEFYVDDLVGCELWDGEHPVGLVSSIEAVAGAAPLLHVALHGAAAGGEALVPFVTAFLDQVSLTERRITMRLPQGLVDINR